MEVQTKSNDKEIQVVGFSLGEEEFGIEIESIQEIIRIVTITDVPKTPEYVEGVINLRGNVIPVIDLRKRFGFKDKEYTNSTRIVVVEVKDKVIGMVVDEVSEVLRITLSDIEPPPSIVAGIGREHIKGIGKLENRIIILIDIDSVILSKSQEAVY